MRPSKAEELTIELLNLPPYSPNLNLIERLWRFVKNRFCIASITTVSILSEKALITASVVLALASKVRCKA
jgi:transposase